MDSSNSGRYFEGVGVPGDTNITAPWLTFLLAAWRHNWQVTAGFVAIPLVLALVVAGYLALTNPGAVNQLVPLMLVSVYLAATILAERSMCRSVFIIRMERDMAVIDHQRWWKADERRIPDSVKKFDGKRPIAWLFPNSRTATHITTGEVTVTEWLEPFTAWDEALVINDDSASAAHIAGIKTTMKASSDIAKYQEPGRTDVAKYGLLVVVILFGLLAAYLAGNEAIEQFITAPAG